MSKTDKTRPLWVRLREAGAEEDFSFMWRGRPTCNSVPRDFKYTNAETNAGPKYIKWAKRYKSKRNRRRDVPLTKMSGYGYGAENYKFW